MVPTLNCSRSPLANCPIDRHVLGHGGLPMAGACRRSTILVSYPKGWIGCGWLIMRRVLNLRDVSPDLSHFGAEPSSPSRAPPQTPIILPGPTAIDVVLAGSLADVPPRDDRIVPFAVRAAGLPFFPVAPTDGVCSLLRGRCKR